MQMTNVLGVFVYPVETFAGSPVVGFTIDSIDLRDHVYPVELPFAQREGNPSLASRYEGLPANEILPPNRHLLGEPQLVDADSGTALLGCECGERGCWPLVADVLVGQQSVVWRNFRQPRRLAPDHWDYDGLGPFTFDREAYVAALSSPWRRSTPG